MRIGLVLLLSLLVLTMAATAAPVEEKFKTPADLEKRLSKIQWTPESALLFFADAQNGIRITEMTRFHAVLSIQRYFEAYYFPDANGEAEVNVAPDTLLLGVKTRATHRFGVWIKGKRPPIVLELDSPIPIREILDCDSQADNTCALRYAKGLRVRVREPRKTDVLPGKGTLEYANLQTNLRATEGMAVLLFTDWGNGIRIIKGARSVFFDAPRGMEAYFFKDYSPDERTDPAKLMERTKTAAEHFAVYAGKARNAPFAPVTLYLTPDNTHPTLNLLPQVVCKSTRNADYCLILYRKGMQFEFKKR